MVGLAEPDVTPKPAKYDVLPKGEGGGRRRLRGSRPAVFAQPRPPPSRRRGPRPLREGGAWTPEGLRLRQVLSLSRGWTSPGSLGGSGGSDSEMLLVCGLLASGLARRWASGRMTPRVLRFELARDPARPWVQTSFLGWASHHFNNLHVKRSLETRKSTRNGNRGQVWVAGLGGGANATT